MSKIQQLLPFVFSPQHWHSAQHPRLALCVLVTVSVGDAECVLQSLTVGACVVIDSEWVSGHCVHCRVA